MTTPGVSSWPTWKALSLTDDPQLPDLPQHSLPGCVRDRICTVEAIARSHCTDGPSRHLGVWPHHIAHTSCRRTSSLVRSHATHAQDVPPSLEAGGYPDHPDLLTSSRAIGSHRDLYNGAPIAHLALTPQSDGLAMPAHRAGSSLTALMCICPGCGHQRQHARNGFENGATNPCTKGSSLSAQLFLTPCRIIGASSITYPA